MGADKGYWPSQDRLRRLSEFLPARPSFGRRFPIRRATRAKFRERGSTIELSETVTLERRGHFALLFCDNPPLNLIGRSVRAGLHAGIRRVEEDAGIEAAIIICRGSQLFLRRRYHRIRPGRHGPSWLELDRAIDLSDKPIIAAIHTRAFGGGLETALACHYRVADKAAVFAFPEVEPGYHPGRGRHTALPPHLRLRGRPRHYSQRAGLRRRRSPAAGHHRSDRRRQSGGRLQSPLPGRLSRMSPRSICPGPAAGKPAITAPRANPKIFDLERANVAPALSRLQRAGCAPSMRWRMRSPCPSTRPSRPRSTSSMNCVRTAEHRALSHMFFAEREARRLPDLPKDLPARKIGQVAVIGGGTMGRGIYVLPLPNGLPRAPGRDQRRGARPRARLLPPGDRGGPRQGPRLGGRSQGRRIERITGGVGLSDAAGADLVVEAVFEDMELKKEFFAELDRIAIRAPSSPPTPPISISTKSPRRPTARRMSSGCISSARPTS